MDKILAIVLGGSIGALCRYWTGLACASLLGSRFPYGTLVVNLCGCFLIGLIFSLAQYTSFITPVIRLFIVTGFLGALTTFSSYAVETVNLTREGLVISSVVNILINNIAGLALVLVGLWAGRLFTGGL
jgi:fluoride exporter